MNREIKFRGKGIEEYDKDKWYYGYYLKLDKTTYCFKEDYERNKDNSEHKIVFDVMTDWGLPNQHKMADVNIDTLGQFTGLYDKKNVPIFEGDIVKSPYTNDDSLYIIAYWKCGFMLQGQKSGDYYDFIGDLLGRLEVIGNIYESEVTNDK